MSDISDWMARHIDEVGINQDCKEDYFADVITTVVVWMIIIIMAVGCVAGVLATMHKHRNINAMLEEGDTNLETTIYKETSSNPPWIANSFWKENVK